MESSDVERNWKSPCTSHEKSGAVPTLWTARPDSMIIRMIRRKEGCWRPSVWMLIAHSTSMTFWHIAVRCRIVSSCWGWRKACYCMGLTYGTTADMITFCTLWQPTLLSFLSALKLSCEMREVDLNAEMGLIHVFMKKLLASDARAWTSLSFMTNMTGKERGVLSYLEVVNNLLEIYDLIMKWQRPTSMYQSEVQQPGRVCQPSTAS